MAKQGQRAEINTFIQGLITEASPLNFPPNASKDEENFELFRDGTRKRRKGITIEAPLVGETELPGGIVIGSTATSSGLPFPNNPDIGKNVFYWDTVEGQAGFDLIALQLGSNIFFYDRNNPLVSITSGYLNTVSTSFPATIRFSFTSVNGKLIVAAGQDTFAVISYASGDTFGIEYKRVKVRDFWGIEAVTEPKYETDRYWRGVLDAKHIYNLRNQSWGLPRKNVAGTIIDPLAEYSATYSVYPSNSEIVWTGIAFQAVDAAVTPYERMFPNLYAELFGSGPPAPKGFFVIDLLSRGQSRIDNTAENFIRSGSIFIQPTLATNADITTGGASVVCEFAGRVFYAGFGGLVTGGDARSPNLTNYVCFSQLVKGQSEINKCYQEGDPTSRDGSDIIDTDGGFIRISGANKIVSAAVLAKQLIIFAENGVWSISGSGDSHFSATSYEVTKLSTYGCIGNSSVVSYGDQVYYWSSEGIYSIAQDKFAQLIVTPITQTTIQSFYDEIPLESKRRAYGVFDEANKRVSWVYKKGTLFTADSETIELILDTTLNCFYKNRIANQASGSIGNLNEVVATFFDTKIRYVTLRPSSAISSGIVFFCSYDNPRFLDWEFVGTPGVDAKAFLLTGSQIAGDSAVHKQTPYVVMHFRKTETETNEFGVPLNQSGCLFRFQWDWADGVQSNKFSSLQQAYRYRKPFFQAPGSTTYDNGFETVTTKNKIRGRGRALALYLETEPLKDCDVLGWNITINGNSIA